mgnify:CR=1 FL=1
MQEKLQAASTINEDEEMGVVRQLFYGSTLQRLEELTDRDEQENRIDPLESVKVYQIIAEMGPAVLRKEEVMVCMKYKTLEKKVLQERK